MKITNQEVDKINQIYKGESLSIAELIDRIGINRNKLGKIITELLDSGIFEVVGYGGGRRSFYIRTDKKMRYKVCSKLRTEEFKFYKNPFPLVEVSA